MKTRNRRTVAQRLFTADNIQLRRMTGTFVFRVFFYSLVIGLSFTMLIKVLPAVFSDFSTLDDPNVVWVPLKFSITSFAAAFRIGFGNNLGGMLWSLLYAAVIAAIQVASSTLAGW